VLDIKRRTATRRLQALVSRGKALAHGPVEVSSFAVSTALLPPKTRSIELHLALARLSGSLL
jgi:hypothetical protein